MRRGYVRQVDNNRSASPAIHRRTLRGQRLGYVVGIHHVLLGQQARLTGHWLLVNRRNVLPCQEVFRWPAGTTRFGPSRDRIRRLTHPGVHTPTAGHSQIALAANPIDRLFRFDGQRSVPVGKPMGVRQAVPHDDRLRAPARGSERPARPARKGRRPRRAVRLLRRMGAGERHRAVPGAGGGADRAGQRRERRPGDADRLGQVAGGHRRAVRGAGSGTAQLLHRAD